MAINQRVAFRSAKSCRSRSERRRCFAFRRLLFSCFVVAAIAAAHRSSPGQTPGKSPKGLTLSHCVVSLIADAQIPAKKPGVVVRFAVAEGGLVKAGEVVAQIDDAEVKVQEEVADRQLKAARKRAENDIDVRYARAAADVARAELLAAYDANNRVAGTIPATEVRRLQLAEKRAILGIEQAEFEFAAAKMETSVAEAQLNAVELDVVSRRIVSPIDGFVVRLHRHEGEWIDAGQPICQVVGLERMRVTGFVNVNEHDQSDVQDRPVKVTVRLASGKVEDFDGLVRFASPIVQPGGEYRVWAEVENRRRGQFWILRPGMATEMSIDLK